MLEAPSVLNASPLPVAGQQAAVTSLDTQATSRHATSDLHPTVTIFCSYCGEVRVVTLRCGRRSCSCRTKLYFRLLRGYLELARSMREPKLLTLTMVTQAELTREGVRKIRLAFQRLLHREYFRSRIRGGLYAIEVSYSGRWNVHLHALIDSLYIDQAELSRAWFDITGDSYIVDIRQAWSPRAGLKYVLKYMLKSPSLNGQEATYDYVLKKTRLVQTFGAFYHTKPEKPNLVCPRCGHSDWISERGLAKAERRGLEMNLALPPPQARVLH